MIERTRNKNILLIGGGGFIGSYLAKDLSQDNNVIILDKEFNVFNKVKNNFTLFHQNIKTIEYDLTSEEPLPYVKLVNYLDPDKEILVFNLAAVVGPKQVISKTDYMNYELQLQLKIKKIIDFLIDKLYIINSFIYFSTSEVYGNQSYQNEHHDLILPCVEDKNYNRNKYSISKTYFENYWKEFFENKEIKNFKFLIIRPFNVIGPFQRKDFVIPIMINKVLNNEEIIIYGDGNQRRNFIYIEDFIYALKRVIDSEIYYKNSYEIFNIANLNNTITIKNLAYKIIQIIKKIKNINYQNDIKFIQNEILVGQKDRLAGIDRLYNDLKFKPEYDLDQSIEKILEIEYED